MARSVGARSGPAPWSAERWHDLGPDGVQDVCGRPLVVGRGRYACLVAGQDDAELPVEAVHAPGVVPLAQPDMPAVPRVVRVRGRRACGDMAAGRHGVGDHAGHVVSRHELLVAVAAAIEQGPAEPGKLIGPQMEPDRAEGVPERAAQPLWVPDSKRGEQPWEQEIPQILTGASLDDAAEQIGAGASVRESGPGYGTKRRAQDVCCGVPWVIGVGVKPAVSDPRRHREQLPDRDRLNARPRSGCHVPEMGQHHIVNIEQPLRLSDADGYRGESFRR